MSLATEALRSVGDLFGTAVGAANELVPYIVLRELAGEQLPAGNETALASGDDIPQPALNQDASGQNLNLNDTGVLAKTNQFIQKYWLIIILVLLAVLLLLRFI